MSTRRQRITAFTKQVDPALMGVGFGPAIGDRTYTGIVLSSAPTVDQSHRYLCRLCGVSIPAGVRGTVVSIKQLLTIGVAAKVEQDEAPSWIFELPVTDPTWHFADGNVSWHLMRIKPGSTGRKRFMDTNYYAPYTHSRDGVDSAILARATPALAAPFAGYVPLNGGLPYGDPVAGFGSFADMRWAWSAQDPNEALGIEVEGPCNLVLFASVHQTDPARRTNKPVLVEDSWLRPEDRFVLQNPDARYWRVGGRLVVDLEPIVGCEERDRDPAPHHRDLDPESAVISRKKED